MTMLPDIDQQTYDQYEAERLRRELEQRQQSFSLQAAIGEKIAGVQSLMGGVADTVGGALGGLTQPPQPQAAPAPTPPPEPAPLVSEPAPAPEPAPSQAAPLESAPAPQPIAQPEPEPTALPSPVAPSPAASPVSPGTPAAAPVSPSPSSPGRATGGGGGTPDLSAWIGSALGAVQRAGGDVDAFARSFNPDAADPVSSALNAASRAGADINAFASSLTAPPKPQPVAVSAPQAAGAGAVAPGAPNEAGQVFPLAGKPTNAPEATYHSRGGSDLMAPRGTPVLSMTGGTVQEVYTDKGDHQAGGNAVLVHGNDGLDYYYAHFDAPPGFKPGDQVQAGQQIGAVGNSGNAWKDGKGDTHLHIGIGHGISSGVGSEGGLGRDYDAQATLKGLLGSVGQGAPAAQGAATTTTAGLSGGGSLSGRVGEQGQAILSGAAGAAGWLGDQGQKALQAILVTEGGLAGARGDNGQSAGPLQFYEGGQLANFARQMGMGLEQAKTYVERNPLEAVQWAIGTPDRPGYLGAAIARGLDQGLTGAALATYAQRTGQVSVSPERAGANYNSLFGGGQGVVSGTPYTRPTSTAADFPTPPVSAPPPSPFQVDQPLVDANGRLTAAATGRRPETTMGVMQAAGIGEPQAIGQPAAAPPPQPQQSPVDKLKSAFGDFLDSLGSAAGNLVTPSGGPMTASQQPTPSDSLTNPIRQENPTTPAIGSLAPPPTNDTAVVPSLGDAKDAILRGDTQAALDALDAAGGAFASSPVGSQVINPVDRPLSPGAPLREDIANAPVLGGALGAARGPLLLTEDELLRMPEAETARALLEKGGGSTTDRDVAEATRALVEAQAIAMQQTPLGAAAGIASRAASAASHGKAPRLSEGAIPATGAESMARAFDQLGAYPSWVRSGIEDFISGVEGSASEKANIVYRWLQDNPLSTVADNPSPVAAEQLADDLAKNVPPGSGVLNAPSRPQPGQMALDAETFKVGDQPHLPTGDGGVFKPEMLLPDYVPQSVLEAQEIARYQREVARWRGQIAESRARDAAAGNPLLKGLDQSDFLGVVPDDPRIARWRQQIADARARDEAAGNPLLKDLNQGQMEGFIPNALDMPKRIPAVLHDLIEGANQRVTDRTAPIDVDKLAQQAGTTADRIRKVWKPDESPANHDTLRAISGALDDSAKRLDDLQSNLSLKSTDRAGNITEVDKDAVVAVVKQLTRHQALQEVLEGRPPSAAEQVKRMDPNSLAAHAEAVQALDEMAKRFKLKDGDEMAKLLVNIPMSDPAIVNNLADTARSFTFGDRVAALWYFAMLSSPLTHIKNMLGNTVVGGLRPFESAGAAGFDPLARRLLGDEGPRQRYIQEAPVIVRGAFDSLDKAIPQAWSALKEGWVPERTGDIAQFSREPFRGTPLEFPIASTGRALTAEDTIYRTMNEGASKFALAEREARKLGLQGEELRDMKARLIQQPTKDMLEKMKEDGAYYVFQNKDRLATYINQGRSTGTAWGRAMRYLMPFTTTPINITKFVAERSPLGAAGIAKDLLTNKGALQEAGSGALADRMSRAAMGSTAWVWFVKQGVDGNLTGAAPSDEADRDAFYRQGKQEYSFRNPIDGKWTSYRAAPFAQMVETAADVADAWNKGQIKDKNDLTSIGISAGLAAGHDMLDQQWLQGVSDFFDAMNTKGDPEAAFGKWVNRQVGGLVPGVVRDAARAEPGEGDIIRDPHNPWDAVKANIPGQSKYVAPALDAMGQVRRRPSGGIGALINPMPGTTPTTDPVELALKELQDLQYEVEPGMTGKSARVGGQDVELSDPQAWRLQEQSGKLAKELLRSMIGTDDWNAMSYPDRQKFVNDAFSEARKFVRKDMEPELVDKAFEEFKRKELIRQRAGAGG